MGFSIDLLTSTEPPDEEFSCAVCMELVETPLMIENCEHIFCAECLEGCRKSSGKCPLDRIEIGSLRPPHRSFINSIGKLKIKCKFSEDGCSHVDKLADIRKHESNCSYREEPIGTEKEEGIDGPNSRTRRVAKPIPNTKAMVAAADIPDTSFTYMKELLKAKLDECEIQKATIDNLTAELEKPVVTASNQVTQYAIEALRRNVKLYKTLYEERDLALKPVVGRILLQLNNIQSSEEGWCTSDVTYLRGLPWCIVAKINPKKSVGFYLRCNGKFGCPSWSCSVIANLKIHSARPGGEYAGTIYHNFHAKETEKGSEEFIDWATLTNPFNCFVMSGNVFLEAELEVDRPRGM
jgi:hypothetical protein